MASNQTTEVARRAKRLYEDKIRASVETAHLHEFIAIEPDSGDYYFGKSLSEAIQAARAAYPDRLAFALRIGHPAAVNIGVLGS